MREEHLNCPVGQLGQQQPLALYCQVITTQVTDKLDLVMLNCSHVTNSGQKKLFKQSDKKVAQNYICVI